MMGKQLLRRLHTVKPGSKRLKLTLHPDQHLPEVWSSRGRVHLGHPPPDAVLTTSVRVPLGMYYILRTPLEGDANIFISVVLLASDEKVREKERGTVYVRTTLDPRLIKGLPEPVQERIRQLHAGATSNAAPASRSAE